MALRVEYRAEATFYAHKVVTPAGGMRKLTEAQIHAKLSKDDNDTVWRRASAVVDSAIFKRFVELKDSGCLDRRPPRIPHTIPVEGFTFSPTGKPDERYVVGFRNGYIRLHFADLFFPGDGN